MIREGRVANVALSSELRSVAPESGDLRGLSIYTTRKVLALPCAEDSCGLRAWRVAFPDGRVVCSRGPLIHARRAHRWQVWVSLVEAPEIFVS